MSSCYKCERELPDGQVECEHGCDVKDGPTGGLLLQIMIEPDAELIQDAQALAEYELALKRFTELLMKSLMVSGLSHFMKRPK